MKISSNAPKRGALLALVLFVATLLAVMAVMASKQDRTWEGSSGGNLSRDLIYIKGPFGEYIGCNNRNCCENCCGSEGDCDSCASRFLNPIESNCVSKRGCIMACNNL